MKKNALTYALIAGSLLLFSSSCDLLDDNEIDNGINGEHFVDVDGNVYNTIIIGEQEWMAENLRVTRYNNLDPILTGLNDDDWGNTTEGAYAIYDHHTFDSDGIDSPEQMVAAYGKLYNWFAAMDQRGICPVGWRIPNRDDWGELFNYVVEQGFPNESGNPNGRGNALRSCRQVDSPLGGDCDTSEHPRWKSHDTHHGFDEFGFSALPSGYRNPSNGRSLFLGSYSLCWSTDEADALRAWGMTGTTTSGSIILHFYNKNMGISIRCIKEAD